MSVIIITGRVEKYLGELLQSLCQSEGYVEALLNTLEGSCSEKSALFTSLCLSHETLKTAISEYFVKMSGNEGGAYKVQTHLASLGLEREVLLNFIKSEIENRVGGSLKTVSLSHLLDVNEDEDEALFFECWTMPGPGGFSDDENAVNNQVCKNLKPLVKKRVLLREPSMIDSELKVFGEVRQMLEGGDQQ